MDLGSGIRKKPILDPGSRCQKGTGSQIRIRNTAESGSISQRHESADPDPPQNVMDPQHWLGDSSDQYKYLLFSHLCML
jgi:hypothetical protein